MRYSGCASLDLAYVASGRLDGFFHNDINLWDVAAGEILVKEAGGLVNLHVARRVRAQNLQRHDERVLVQICAHRTVEHVHGGVVRGGGEQRVLFVERHGANAVGVARHHLVRHVGEVHVEPLQLTVAPADDDVVAAGVCGEAGHAVPARHQLLHQALNL